MIWLHPIDCIHLHQGWICSLPFPSISVPIYHKLNVLSLAPFGRHERLSGYSENVNESNEKKSHVGQRPFVTDAPTNLCYYFRQIRFWKLKPNMYWCSSRFPRVLKWLASLFFKCFVYLFCLISWFQQISRPNRRRCPLNSNEENLLIKLLYN